MEQKLKSVVDGDYFGGKKSTEKKKNPKQFESVFAFCRVLKLFPDVHVRCIVLVFKNGHASGKSFDETGMKNGWVGGNGQKERSTMKTSVTLFEKHEIMCCDPVFFCPFLK